MSKTLTMQSVTMTKKLEAICKRYGVTLRKRQSKAIHVMTKHEIDCDPVTFAAFEAAIQAVYRCNLQYFVENGWNDYILHYQRIATVNDFALPALCDIDPHEEKRRRAAEDYRYCAHLLMRAEVYYALLD